MKREITSKRGLSNPNLLEVDLDNGYSFAKPSRRTTSKQLVLAKTRSIENLEEKLEKEKQERIRQRQEDKFSIKPSDFVTFKKKNFK